jgi:hypothetical protein
VPWHLYKDHPEADGDIPEEEVVEADAEAVKPGADTQIPPVVVKTRQVPPRAFQIRKEDAEKHGYTRGCPGCSSWFRALGRQPHSAECRVRFAETLKGDLKFQNAEKRKQDFEEKMRGKQARKQQREEDSRKHKQQGAGEASGSGLPREERRRGGGDQDMEVAEPVGEKRVREDGHTDVGCQGSADRLRRRRLDGDTMHETAMQAEPREGDDAKGSGRRGDTEMTTAAIERWEDVIDFLNEQEVLQVAVDGDWAWDDVRDKPLDVSKGPGWRRSTT